MKNKTILHYKLVKKIGKGGMGIVYLAWDTKLERKVAIKFLPPDISSSSDERDRFITEAKAAAALNHPNIMTIYAIEETGEGLFLVMEYIKGKDLKELVEKKTISPGKAIHIASQIAQGLKAAHDKKIVHRDIKSSNIMVADSGQVKIMDFGVAKMRRLTHDDSEENSTFGTTAYMSPEQANRENVDFRTDIWSLGVILYEILKRELPFKGDYEQAIIYSILNEEPAEIKNLNFGKQGQINGIVKKCLEKDVSKRYSDASEIADDLNNIVFEDTKKILGNIKSSQSPKLKILLGITVLFLVLLLGYLYLDLKNHSGNNNSVPMIEGPSKIEKLAILPFTNLKNDPDTNYLGYAMADQIIGSLTYIQNITVCPSSAVRKYENELIDIPSVARELRSDYILAGNYLKEGELIRLNIELISIRSNELIWRELIEVKFDNVFNLQDKVSEKVINGLKIRFTEDEMKRMHRDVPGSSLAYEYYLRGVSFPSTIEGSRMAVEMLNKSIKLDPLYAPAFSELGFRLHQLAMFDLGETDKFEQAEKALLKALSLNENLLDAMGNLAGMYTDTGEIEKAVKLLRRSLKVNPNNANTHFFLGYAYRYAGVLDEAVKEMEKAVELDPGNNRFRSIGTTYTYLGEYEKALKAFELDSGSPFSLAWQGQVYLRMGQKKKALELIWRTLEIEPDSKLGLWARGMEGYLTGDLKKGLSAMRKSAEFGSSDSEQIYHNANIHGLLGDVPGSIALLKRSVDKGFFCYPFMLRDSFLDSARDHPEFKKILEKAKEKYLSFKKKFF